MPGRRRSWGPTWWTRRVWLVPAADTGAARALTTDANLIPRERAQRLTPPVETYWAPNSRIVLVSYTDQQQIAPYPYIESAPRDGSFRPRVHPIRIPLVGEHSAPFEWYLIDTDTGARQRVDLPYAQLLALQQDMTAFREVAWSPDSKQLFLVTHGENMLTKANKDFEFSYLPSRDHQFIGDAYVMRRDWDFMVRNLLGREPPAGYRISMDHR
jgi:Dipeptidyl peptidase IV (DPP IV) N-terminal region